ncbi:uncharacterized protein LTR77_001641 [Saxophila tyrrhenica]|uniref:Uncharacterized protein n=1 Tax=Saxophila tyrrhenica TaxID=1690608 RepID=A0AAV9PLM9_9PEZI|nr:hypothetical protein LTR77_001641 [Saxophila tyrrhenica]
MKLLTVAVLSLYLDHAVFAQSELSISSFEVKFTEDSGVLRSLRPSTGPSFDFSPSDVFQYRNEAGQYHTGDLTFHYRTTGSSQWQYGDTAACRKKCPIASHSSADAITSNLNEGLPHLESSSLNVTRSWSGQAGDLALSFTIENNGDEAIELGSLGMPIEFNNIFTNRSATEATEKCVFVDPYIGLDAGFLQVTRLTGTGPSLVITPLNDASKFEAWQFLEEPEDVPLGYRIQTYEGNYAYQVHTSALAETQWRDAEPWNPPTSAVLEAGESLTVGLRFSVASGVQQIEDKVAEHVPVAVGTPGYVVPQDLTAKLFLKSRSDISSINVYPKHALSVAGCGTYDNSWKGFDVTASLKAFGRVRLDIVYEDGTHQAVHYWIAHSSPKAVSELGSFLTHEQWYTNTSDPFGRAPSVITYNRTADDYVLQDNRTWIAGLSDEGGAGSFLAAGMKQAIAPNAPEVAKLEQMVEQVVWGRLQISSGNETYAVRKSLFYYQPELVPNYEYDPYFNWTINPGESWDKEAAYLIDRTYDYVHVSALYWGLYRAGRTNPDILSRHSKEWYLSQAYNTVRYSVSNTSDGTPRTGYWDVGLMGETVWGLLLADLYAENYPEEAAHMEHLMQARQALWAGQADPFGSEMAWDSTGEEGVYYWSRYFNDSATADKSVNAIRGYMPTIPHWGWNGNARRYWDFLYAGSIDLARIERQIHHYGSGLNALPMLDNYRRHADPQSLDAIYDLRIGYGGNQGPLTNIDEDGFGSMAFHSYPDTLIWDAYSGDYGPNFLGHVLGAATYLVDHPTFGWVSFGGNVKVSEDGLMVRCEPRDAVRRRIFVAAISLWVEIDAGTIEYFTLDAKTQQVKISVSGESTQRTVMVWEQTGGDAKGPKMKPATKDLKQRTNGYELTLPTTVSFTAE